MLKKRLLMKCTVPLCKEMRWSMDIASYYVLKGPEA